MNSVSAARLGAITGAVLGTAPLVEPMRGYAAVAADAKWGQSVFSRCVQGLCVHWRTSTWLQSSPKKLIMTIETLIVFNCAFTEYSALSARCWLQV